MKPGHTPSPPSTSPFFSPLSHKASGSLCSQESPPKFLSYWVSRLADAHGLCKVADDCNRAHLDKETLRTVQDRCQTLHCTLPVDLPGEGLFRRLMETRSDECNSDRQPWCFLAATGSNADMNSLRLIFGQWQRTESMEMFDTSKLQHLRCFWNFEVEVFTMHEHYSIQHYNDKKCNMNSLRLRPKFTLWLRATSYT